MRAPSPKSAVADLGTQFCRSRVNPRSVPSSTLRDARTRVRLCGSARACALLRMRTAEPAARRRTVFGHSDLTMSNSPSRSRDAFLRPGFATLLHSPPNEGWAERRETFGCSAEHPCGVHITRHARRLARRLASHDAGRSPLGAPPWRFWAPGAALLSPAFAPDRLQRAPRTQVVVPGGRGPEPPGTSGYKPPPQDATPRSAFRFALENAPSMSEAGNGSSIASNCSQVKNAFCRRKKWTRAG